MLRKSIRKNKKTITIQQIDAHMCKAIGSEEGLMEIWDIISYEKTMKIRGRRKLEKMTFSFFDRRGDKFPYGLVDYVSEKMNNLGYEIILKEIDSSIKTKIIPKLPNITFEKYQKSILRLVGKNKRGIFVAPTASGKTIIAAGIISRLDIPVTLFVTINKSIFNQTFNDFVNWFPDIEIGRIGDGVCEVSHITVALYQSLAKYDLKKYSQILELFIGDETHAASKSIGKIMSQLTKTHYRYGLTATPQKEENDKHKYLEMTGNIGSILRELDDDVVKARVVDCEVYMINYICKEPSGKKYHDTFRQDICLSKQRNIKLLKAAKKLALDKGKTVLFLVDEVSQAELVFELANDLGIKCFIAHGKNKTGINEDIKNKLSTRKINMVVATAVFKTGMNIPSLDCLVLGSARKSEISILQGIGRSRRTHKGKDKAIIIDSFDRVIGNKPFHNYFGEYSIGRLKLYKTKGWFKKKLLI